MHEYFIFMHENRISMHENENSMHEIFMHENEDFAPQKLLGKQSMHEVVYTFVCPTKILHPQSKISPIELRLSGCRHCLCQCFFS